MILLQVSGLAKSVYYYTLAKNDKDDKNKEIIDKIKEIFLYHKERYGYRRITLELRNQGYKINHKKVYRLMVKLGLKPLKILCQYFLRTFVQISAICVLQKLKNKHF